MVAYELYFRDPVKGNELIGILPERRKGPARIVHQSVLHWAETVLGNSSSNKDTFYIKVTIVPWGTTTFIKPHQFNALWLEVKSIERGNENEKSDGTAFWA